MGTEDDETPASDRVEADPTSSDPRRIRSLAVTGDDVVDALEANARGRDRLVLRVTPPFSGRMRARLHDAGVVEADGDAGEGNGGLEPIHLPPERFVADAPPYPTVDDTEDELRASSTAYSREEHRRRHQRAVEAWRERVRERLVADVEIETEAGAQSVSISYL
ncbi:hypothetical protein [Halobellus rubicundus]|uniref:DUF8009 domain-containing protein n=1 Tax=Halobellus rubicundus TaxID=2996466 RepID=A0ABD5ME16_9EURY